MSDNRFTAATPAGGDDRFGYFGAPVPPAGAPVPGQFGAGPAGAPPNPFGPPPPGPTAPFGTPGYGAAPAAAAKPSRAKPIIIAVIVMAVLGALGVGYRAYAHSRPVTLPAALGGLPVSSDPSVLAAVTNAQKELEQENPGIAMQFKAYGVDNNRILIAAVARGRTNVGDDLATFGNNIGQTHSLDGSTCATSSASHVTVCERSDGDLTVIAVSVTRAPAADESSVAALVGDIWRQA
jgi:hypothetical protein